MPREPAPSTAEFLSDLGEVFAVFDQGSGHISYGVRRGHSRFFVKTAGGPARSAGGASYADRIGLLSHAAQIHDGLEHPALIRLLDLVTTTDGIAVVYEWFDGELLRAPQERREDPREAHNRFKQLPAVAAVGALDQVIDLHVAFERRGWVAGDFYDGCLMYDFTTGRIRVIDFECYHRGDYVNDRGVLPGSSRFMAPEECERGARIDSRTTVFNLARMLQIFLVQQHIAGLPALLDGATATLPAQRPRDVADLQRRWRAIVGPEA